MSETRRSAFSSSASVVYSSTAAMLAYAEHRGLVYHALVYRCYRYDAASAAILVVDLADGNGCSST